MAQTYASLCTTLTTFLTVAVHTLLYNRACYPASSFLLARAYNYPVRQSRHPAVCAWISDAIEAVHSELLAGTLSRVALVICNPRTAAPLERFVFDLGRLPFVSQADAQARLVREGEENLPEEENVDISESLRAVLAKVATINARLGPIPSGCPFTLAIELKDDIDVDPPLGHPQPWIPAQPASQKTKLNHSDAGGEAQTNGSRPSRLGKDLIDARVIPIRSVDAGELLFEMWAEEGLAKYNAQGAGFDTSAKTDASISKTEKKS